MNNTFENSSVHIDRYNLDPLLSCEQLIYIGFYCIFLIIMAIGCNSIVIYTYFKEEALLKPINFMLFSYCLICILAAVTEVPMVTFTSFKCKYPYGKFGCEIGGFSMYFCGCSSVYLLMAVSIERLLVIYKPAQQISIKKSVLTVCLCCFLGLLWALFPFMGWSYYSLEGVNISCSVEWRDQSWNVVSYNIAIFIFVFIIPFSILCFTTFKFLYLVIFLLVFRKKSFKVFLIHLKLKKFRSKISDIISVQTVNVRIQKEQRMTIHLIISVCKF
jgi:hypothetical protein